MPDETDDFFNEASNPPVDPLREDLVEMIRQRNDATPRHQQRELGPSEVGHPCMRKMAYGMMEVPRCNPQFDPLPSIIGTATHTWLESAAMYANHQLGRQRWLVETRVNVAGGLAGSCDLYDHDTATVIDWKCPGTNRFDMYRKKMSPVFINQVHLYAHGFEQAGLPVKRVGVALLPRGGYLSGLYLWQDDYDPARTQKVLKRRETVMQLLDEFQVEQHPERYQWIPTAPYDCMFCPWFKPDPKTPLQCRGDQ
jgi:hypothetical protein